MNKYESHIKPYLLEIEKWAGKGATEKEIAGKLGVSYSTLRKHINAEPELCCSASKRKEPRAESDREGSGARRTGEQAAGRTGAGACHYIY